MGSIGANIKRLRVAAGYATQGLCGGAWRSAATTIRCVPFGVQRRRCASAISGGSAVGVSIIAAVMSDEPASAIELRVLAHWIEHCPQRCRRALRQPGGLIGAVRAVYEASEPAIVAALVRDPRLTLETAARAQAALFPPPERTTA